MKHLFALLLVCSCLCCFAQEEDEYSVPNEYIVMLKPTHHIEDVMKTSSDLQIKKCLSKRMNIWLLTRGSTSSSETLLHALQINENVKLAQYNHRIQQRAMLLPNDTLFNLQWNMQNTGQLGGLVGADIDATDAWAINHNNVTVNGDTIVIAIIDGTFDLAHEDINYFINHAEIPGNGVDDDGNGYIDDYEGWNVYDTTGSVNSTGFDASHSTHCAGIAAAIGDNHKGIAGVCWGAKILPIAGSSSVESQVVAAYDYVISMRALYNNSFGTQGAFVVSTNSSFGVGQYGANPANYPIWCAMYDSMGYYGILSAVAAPNTSVNVDIAHDVPTQCPSKWMIGVTNTTRGDTKNSQAAYGKISVGLGAPGTGIESTVPPSSYTGMTGTSMATPHVAGTIAAMYAASCKGLIDLYYQQPDSAALLIKQYLLDAAQWNSSLNNITASNGRLNLYRAILNVGEFNCDSCSFTPVIGQTAISCKNANDGMLSISLAQGNISADNVLWSTGSASSSLTSKGPGFYTVTVTDTFGCSRFASAELHDPDTIKVTGIAKVPATDSTVGNIIVQSNAGNEPLQFSLDGINYQQSAIFIVDTNGAYTVYVKNGSGCIVEQQVTLSNPAAGIDEADNAAFSLSIYPNPANSILNVSVSCEQHSAISISVQNMLGQNVFSTTSEVSVTTHNSIIDLKDFASGVYLLHVSNDHTSVTRKFVLER